MGAKDNITGYVGVRSWAGYSRHRVVILGETPKRYRVRYDDPSRLPARLRARGPVQFVPKPAVVIDGHRGRE